MHPKEKIGLEDWKELEKTVENLIPSFIPLLKERLSEKEYHICLLVKLGFSTSFIANLVGITSSGVSASRKAMLAKLCSRVGSPKDFDEYVRKIQ
jgi:DNA-binding NarL/FixJ family response regulator